MADIWSALRQKDNKALKDLIAKGADVNASGAVRPAPSLARSRRAPQAAAATCSRRATQRLVPPTTALRPTLRARV